VDFWLGQLIETHTDEFVLERQFDFADIITNEAELHIVAAYLQEILERLLGVFGHIIDFIEDDKFVPGFKQILGSDELVDLVANSVDAAFIGCIQMDDETLVDMVLRFLVFVDKIYYSSGFAGAGGSIQEQIGEVFVFQHS
jgi:hypothetical protein